MCLGCLYDADDAIQSSKTLARQSYKEKLDQLKFEVSFIKSMRKMLDDDVKSNPCDEGKKADDRLREYQYELARKL